MLLLILKSSACLAVFMLFYKLFLEKESIHQFKRFYLLGTLVVSMLIPFITFTQYIEAEPIQEVIAFQPLEFTSEEPIVSKETKTWQDYLPMTLWIVYGIGVLLFSIRFIINLKTIFNRIKNNPKHQYHQFTNVLLKDLVTPHTFFKYIFLNKNKYEQNLIPHEVLLHEQTHAKQKHALDILCIEILQIIFWFNLLLYFIKKDIRLNHEFLADQAVLQNGVNATQYKQTLLDFSSGANKPTLSNAINYSLIKKRFNIMKTQTSKRAYWLKSLLVFPILAILIYSFSQKEVIEKEATSHTETLAIQQTSKDKGATKVMMKEYRDFTKAFEKTKRINGIKLNRIIAIYDIMTPAQRATVKMYPKTFFPSSLSKVKPKKPLEKEFNSWKNKTKFAIWIDGKVVDNSELNKYFASDFKYFTSSFVYNNARSKRFPQPYQNHLYTKKGFEESYLKSGVKKYNHLKSKYLKAIENQSLNKDELRILKTQVERAFKLLTKDEIEKYDVEKLPSSKTNTSNDVVVTREQVIEYNKLWHNTGTSSEEFNYTQQTYWIKDKNGKKIAKKYYELSEEDKKKFLMFPPPAYTKKQISKEAFEKLFDASLYVVRINGDYTNNSELKKHKHTYFVSFSKSKIPNLAELTQKYHYNLFTESGLKMNIQTKKFMENYKPKLANPNEEHYITKIIKAGNYPLEIYFRKQDDTIVVSLRKKQMVEAVKKDKFKTYLQDLIKEIALKSEKIVAVINIEKDTEKSKVSFIENTLRNIGILKISKKDYVKSKLNSNIPPPPPPIDIIHTYNSLAKRAKFIPRNRENNLHSLKTLFNKMSSTQKEKVEKPSSINKYIERLNNLTTDQVKKVNKVLNKINAKAQSQGRKFYSTKEYKTLEDLYTSLLLGKNN